MRLKSFFLWGTIVSFALTVFTYCSADYDYSGELTSITLKANTEQTVVGIDQELVFTVVNSNSEENLTAQAVIYRNGEPMEGNIESFTLEGIYSYYAVLDDLTSNTLTFEVVSNKYITVNKTKVLRNQQVVFGFFDELGNDLSEDAAFFVNGTAIVGNMFSTADEGNYEVTVVYEDETFDNGIAFEVFIPRKKVVFEDYTGAWCGWCPRVVTAIQELHAASPYVIGLAIHNNDEMAVSQEAQLREMFNVVAFPAARMDRTIEVPSPEDSQAAIDFVLEQAGVATQTSIAIQTQLNGTQLSVETKITSENGLPSSYKQVVYIYQDGLIFPQVNYYVNTEGSPWYGLGNPIPDFVHNEVWETSLTNIFGDPIASTAAFEEYTVSYTPVNLSSYGHTTAPNTFNPERFGVIVMLVDETNRAVNAQYVKAGQSVNFQ